MIKLPKREHEVPLTAVIEIIGSFNSSFPGHSIDTFSPALLASKDEFRVKAPNYVTPGVLILVFVV